MFRAGYGKLKVNEPWRHTLIRIRNVGSSVADKVCKAVLKPTVYVRILLCLLNVKFQYSSKIYKAYDIQTL